MPKYSAGGLRVWYGTADAPAPTGEVAPRHAHPIRIGVSPSTSDTRVFVRFKRAGGRWKIVSTVRRPGKSTAGVEYFDAVFEDLPAGATVEYEIICEQGGRRIMPTRSVRATPSRFSVLLPSQPADFPDDDERSHSETDSAVGEVLDVADSGEATVRGLVRYRFGTAIAGALVRAYNINLRSEDHLGDCVTDSFGRYLIRYSTEILKKRNKLNPDLRLRVHRVDDAADASAQNPIAETRVYRAATRLEKIKVLVDGSDADVWSEFDQLSSEVRPLLEGIALADLDETSENQDVSFLSSQLGQPRERIEALVSSSRLARATKLPSAFFYGLLRDGLPASLPGLLAIPPDALQATLRKAFRHVWIPWALKQNLDALVRAFYAASVPAALDTERKSANCLDEILSIGLPGSSDRVRLLTLYLEHTGSGENFWKKAALDPSLAPFVPLLKKALCVAAILGGDAKLGRLVVDELRSSPFEALTRWSKSKWKALIQEAHSSANSFPPGIAGKTATERAANYADRVARVVRALLRDADLVNRGSDGLLGGLSNQGTRQFFRNLNARDEVLDFGRANIRRIVSTRPELVRGVLNASDLERDLTRVQSLFKVSKSAPVIKQLLDKGYPSVLSLALPRYSALKQVLGPQTGDLLTRELHAEATRTSAGALALLGEFSAAANQVRVYSIGSPGADSSALAEWAPVFSSGDLLACEHCQSVLSPAAYYVEALEFLREKSGRTDGVSAFDNALVAMLTRRPDLQHVELTCANTSTEVPYIDLVNEILAEAAAPFEPIPLGITTAQLNGSSAADELRTSIEQATTGISTRCTDPLATRILLSSAAELRPISDAGRWVVRDRGKRFLLEADASGAVSIINRSYQTWVPRKRTGRDRDADGESPMALPQHVNPDAVCVLRAAHGALPLPFDLWHANVAGHLNQIRIPRHELMEAFREAVVPPGGSLANADAAESYRRTTIAIERMGFSWPEWETMAWYGQSLGSYEAIAADRWEFEEPMGEDQSLVRVILAQASLTMAELEQLLDCDYINPGGHHRIDTSTPDFRISSLDATFLLRLHDFIRLWRKLGWKVHEVDRIILALRTTENDFDPAIDDAFARNLAAVLELKSLLSIDVATIIAITADISTVGDNSDYHRLFLSAPDSPDALRLVEGALSSDELDWAQWMRVEAILRGAFRVKQRDLRRLLKFSGVWLGDVPTNAEDWSEPNEFTVASLSSMRRMAAFARALNLSIEDFICLRWLSGTDALDRADRKNAVRFARVAQELGRTGLTIAELDGLLGSVEEDEPFFVDDEQVAARLAELRAALSQAPLLADAATCTASDLRNQLRNLGWIESDIDSVLDAIGGMVSAGIPVQLPLAALRYAGVTGTVTADGPLSGVAMQALGKLRFTPGSGVDEDGNIQGQLAIDGPLSTSDREVLRTLVEPALADSARQAEAQAVLNAVESLYSVPRQALREHAATHTPPVFSAFLKGLPEGFTLPSAPPELNDRLTFDDIWLELRWKGPLDDTHRAALDSASADEAYRRALAELATSAAAYVAPASNRLLHDDSAIAAVLDVPGSSQERLNALGAMLASRNAHRSRELAVFDFFATQAGVPSEVAQEVFGFHLHPPAAEGDGIQTLFLDETFSAASSDRPPPSDFPLQFQGYRRAIKALGMVNRLGLDPVGLRLLRSESRPIGCLDFDSLPASAGDPPAPFEAWRALAAFAAFGKRIHRGSRSLATFLRLYTNVEESNDAFLDRVSAVQAWNRVDLAYVLDNAHVETPDGRIALSSANAMRRWQSWERVFQCMNLLRRLGCTAEQAVSWCSVLPSEAAARAAHEVVRALYDEAQWPSVSQAIQDPIREKHRAALVAYLLTLRDGGRPRWKDENALYAHFLIDVEMGSCMTTSRLRQAMSAVQLFVQRCFLNRERGKDDSEPGVYAVETWKPWELYRRYRIWEASRRIFLTPENWLEPELRDDKSPLFEALESELLQNDVNEATVGDALLNYLEGLNEISNLHVAAVLHEEHDSGEGAKSKVTHVFARTRGIPAIHYHRQRVGDAKWGPWRRIDLDIDAEQLVPVIWNRRLHLFWPVFTEAGDPPRWKIQMACSEYSRGRWTARRVTSQHMMSNVLVPSSTAPQTQDPAAIGPDGNDRSASKARHRFKAVVEDDSASIYWQSFEPAFRTQTDPFGYPYEVETGTSYYAQIGEFRFLGCGNETQAIRHFSSESFSMAKDPLDGPVLLRTYQDGASPMGIPRRLGTRPRAMDLVEDGTEPMFLPQSADESSDRVVLASTRGLTPYRFVHPHDRDITSELAPFFFQDASYAFYVDQKQVTVDGIEWQKVPDLGHIDWFARNFYLDYYLQPFDFKRIADPWPFPSSVWASISERIHSRSSSGRGAAENPEPLTTGQPVELTLPPATLDRVPEFEWFKPQPGLDLKKQLGAWRADLEAWKPRWPPLTWKYVPVLTGPRQEYRYEFTLFQHPFVCDFIEALKRDGIDGLYEPGLQSLRSSGGWFQDRYRPTGLMQRPGPKREVDFSYCGTYSLYNWELFFHVPLLIAIRLSQNQRFEEAHKWFHRIFNPYDRSDLPAPQRFWQCKPLRRVADPNYVRKRLDELAQNAESHHPDPEFEYQLRDLIEQPFNPHAVARMRLFAYQRSVIQRYVQNIIDWGDSLFRQDTMESLNEAATLYLLAIDVLGPKPIVAKDRRDVPVGTCADLEPMENRLAGQIEQLSTLIPETADAVLSNDEDRPALLGKSLLYFCFPTNEQLLGLWDTVHDRLFKIRNCQNIEGVSRRLALFDPPIDPAILVRAAAAGLDLGQVLSDLYAPRPHYRFEAILGLVKELVNDVKAFGGALLSAMEKRDAENLALLRSGHEIELLGLVKDVRKKQIEEGKEQLESLKRTRKTTEARRDYYRDIKKVSDKEQRHLDKMSASQRYGQIASVLQAGVAIASMLPQVHAQMSASGTSTGGLHWGEGVRGIVELIRMRASHLSYEATRYATRAGHDRRWDDWKLQEKLASRELDQLDKQIAAAEIRLAISEYELRNHEAQIENAEETDRFMRDRFTNKQLYDWMVGQLAAMHYQAYKLAYDWAKKAERSYQYDLCEDAPGFVEFGLWDSVKKGLLSGERLERSLRRMETSFREKNRREHEQRKDISLARTDPMALVALRQKGECFIRLPEGLFDLDQPGHYRRRIKSVTISIPGVIGPYMGVHGKLTLLTNFIRVSDQINENGDNYLPELGEEGSFEDDRFRQDLGGIQSIATSHGNNDSGLFELNFRDERYLPFEGAGVISYWRLELPKDTNAFDFETIADVVLHMSYTARDGGARLADAARKAFGSVALEEGDGAADPRLLLWSGPPPSGRTVRLFSLRRNFPEAWLALQTADENGNRNAQLTISHDVIRAPRSSGTPELVTADVVIDADAGESGWSGFFSAAADTEDVTLDNIEIDPAVSALHKRFDITSSGESEDWILRVQTDGDWVVRDIFLVLTYET